MELDLGEVSRPFEFVARAGSRSITVTDVELTSTIDAPAW